MSKTRRGTVLAVGATCILIALALSQVGCATDVGNLAGDIGDEQATSEQSVEPTSSTGKLDDIPGETRWVAQNGPVFVMHKEETFWPCSIDWFLEHSVLKLADGSVISTPTRSVLASAAAHGVKGTIEVQDANWKTVGSVAAGQPDKKLHGDWPAYVGLAKITVTGSDIEYLVAKYSTFYAYNTFRAADDVHWGDWEGAIMVFSRKAGSSDNWVGVKLYTKRHGGSWRLTEENAVKKDSSTGHWKVWVANHSHGTWPDNRYANAADEGGWDDLGDGYAWDTRGSANEIVEYVEMEFAATPNFGADDLWLWTNAASKKLVYRDGWFWFQGTWGQSSPATGFSGNSPWSNGLGFALQGALQQ